MAVKGTALNIAFVAWDTYLNEGKTGQTISEMTLKWVKDGAVGATLDTTTIVELDDTNTPGLYQVGLSATECTAAYGVLAGISSTDGVSIIPVHIAFEIIPDATAITAAVPSVGSIQSGLATAAALGTVDGKIDTLDTVADLILVDTIAGGAGPWTSAASAAGSGAISKTITITKDAVAVDGAEVWISTDEAGTVVVAGTLVTDIAGEVTFMLDAYPTYWAWVQKGGVNFATNPTTFAVTA